MIYDGINIYYNYTMKKICRVILSSHKQCIHLTISLFLVFFFFFNVLNFCMEVSKTEFIARVIFT